MAGGSNYRKIIHIDMDAFYASVEQRDNPDLRGRPVAVGGSSDRGVVAAASYEARKFGVKSAMPSAIAARNCPDLVFVKPRFTQYRDVSNQIRSIFYEYTDLVEPLSLDEAYLDVTNAKRGLPSATLIAQEIRQRILETTQLTSSAGVSFNKFLAKTASDVNKPNGQFVILPEDADRFTADLPIHRFFGIGKVTAEKMKKAGIFFGRDLRKFDLPELTRRFGKAGAYYHDIVRGIDDRQVKPDRERKSVSVENTFDSNLMQRDKVLDKLATLTDELFRRYKKQKIGKTVTIKVKYGDFRQITRSKTIENGIVEKNQVLEAVDELVTESLMHPEGIRLLGVGISNFLEDVEMPQLVLKF